nr:restriction endonuclease subunit S [uncultured Prevotella sp.]
METTTYKISDIGEVVGGGTPSTANSNFWGGDIPWISPKDLTGYKSVYISHGENFLTKTGLKSGTKLLPKGTVLFSSRAPIGYVAIASNTICTNQGFKSIICNKEIINPLFLYYYIKGNLNYIKLFGTGATFPEISGAAMRKIKVQIPSIPTQQKIASILSAYDRLIENNTLRIRLLEQMAENLYKEWFIRFRFPEHENVEMVNGLPKGWEVKRISNVCETIGGGTPSTTNSAYWGGDIKWVTPSDITSKKSLALLKIAGRITEEGLKKSSAKLLPPYTILMTSRASIGFFGICPDNVCTNQGFISIIPNKDNVRMYLLYTFKARKEEIISNANGSTFLEISKGRFRKMKLLVPTEDILNMFEKRTMLNFREVLHLEMQNQLLTRQRDLLLPRLMSGKLEVKS